MHLTTNEILKASKKTPILLKRTLEALTPEARAAFSVEFALQVAAMENAAKKANIAPLVRPDNARECENLLKRTMRLS